MRAAFTLTALVLAAPASAQGILPFKDPAAVDAGKEIYAEHCASCHGENLEGEGDWRRRKPSGLMPAPPHDATGHTWHHPDEQLVEITRDGLPEIMARRGLDYESDMIGFGDVLSDEQILQVLAYIKSTWPEDVIEMHDSINADQ